MERNERMKQQEELCKEMSNSNERNANAFLELFGNVCESKTTEKAPRKPNKKILTSDKNNEKFIQRNIQLAKRGKMMTSSLTDEEKQKLDELLKDIDLDVEETEDEIYSQVDDEPEESSDDEKSCSNDFGVSGADRKRLEEINTELNKYSKNETCAAPEEEVDQRLPKTYKNWKEFLNDSRSSQALKEIEAKLEALCMESDDDESEVQN